MAATVLEEAATKAQAHVHEVLTREKDPFTLNDFLQQWVNKLRHDRFTAAVETAFAEAHSNATQWQALKEEVCLSLRSWYRGAHAISARASAQEMSGTWCLSTYLTTYF